MRIVDEAHGPLLEAGTAFSAARRRGMICQYGRNFPTGGMNEAGLVIELMWLDGSRYPVPDARPAVDNLQWIQYNLVRSWITAGLGGALATAGEAIAVCS